MDFRERQSRTRIMYAKAAMPARCPDASVQCPNDRLTGHVSMSAENCSLVTTENCALRGYGEGSGAAGLSGRPRTSRTNRHWSCPIKEGNWLFQRRGVFEPVLAPLFQPTPEVAAACLRTSGEPLEHEDCRRPELCVRNHRSHICVSCWVWTQQWSV